jgi:hypothetical protein
MPARHFRSSFTRVRGSRRRLAWASLDVNAAAIAHNGVFNIDLLSPIEAAGSSKLGVTIMRLILTGAFTMDIGGFWTVGCTVAQTFELAPDDIDPDAQKNLDFMYLTRLYPHASGATVDATNPFHSDIRSHRKCAQMGETLGLVATNKSNAAAESFSLLSRVLVALP